MIYVAYGVIGIDTSWIDPSDRVIVVNNDRLLPPNSVAHENVLHLTSERNVGFGAGVNLALEQVETARVVLCNPDATLTAEHYRALVSDDADELVTIPLSDAMGRPTWVVLPYPGALAALAMAYRLGRVLGRDTRLRSAGSRLLGSAGGSYAWFLGVPSGTWSLQTHWVSGAVLSLDTARFRAIGGFDAGYFLYMEDVDLCWRLAARFPAMQVRVADCVAGHHAVAGSVSETAQSTVELHRLHSVQRYCSRQRGLRWRLVHAATRPRQLWLMTRTRRMQTRRQPG